MHNDLNTLLKSGKHKQAIDLIKKQLKRNRNEPALLNTLGCVYADSGDHKSARNIFKKIISMNPASDQAYFNLGLSYKVTKDIQNAIRCYEKAIKLKPSTSTYYINLGNALFENHSYREAISVYQKALDINKNDANANYNLGKAYLRCGLIDDAIQAYSRSLQISPANHTRNNLANALLAKGDVNKAQNLYLEILRSEPEFLDAISGLVKAYDLQQDFTAAYELVSPHIGTSMHSGIATAFARIADKIDKTDIAIDWLDKILASAPPPDELSDCCFELANIHDRRSEYDQAFAYYEKANSLVQNRFDKGVHRAKIDSLIAVFSTDSIDDIRHKIDLPPPAITPVFIIGMPRSGTSLLERMLSSHHKVSAAGELDNFNSLNDSLFLEARNIREYERALKQVSPIRLLEFRESYLNTLAEHADGAAYVTDKMPNNYINAGLVSILFPESSIIHIKRNAVDTCLSCYFQNFSGNLPFASDLNNLCHVYLEYEKIMRHWARAVPDRLINITYEELIEHPEETLQNITEKLDLDWDANCLNFHKSGKTTTTSSYDQVRRPLYTSSRHRWKNYEKHITALVDCLQAD